MSVRRLLLLVAQCSGWDARGGKGRGGAEHVEHGPDGGVGKGLDRRAPGVRDSWVRGAGFVLSGRFCSRKYGGRVIPSAAA